MCVATIASGDGHQKVKGVCMHVCVFVYVHARARAHSDLATHTGIKYNLF